MYPTLEEVNQATHEQICRWCRYLPSPGSRAIGQPDFEMVLAVEGAICDRISERFRELKGFTPAISKKVGWDG